MRQPCTFRAAADADECERRLTAATSVVGNRYYLNRSNAGRAAPKFRGVKDPLHPVQIARWQSTRGRDSIVAWSCADLVDDGRGGTEVRGWVGVDPRWSGFWPVWIVLSTLWSILFVYSGLRVAISGRSDRLISGHAAQPDFAAQRARICRAGVLQPTRSRA